MTKISVIIDGHPFEVEITETHPDGSDVTVVVDGQEMTVGVPSLQGREHMEWILIGNRPYEIIVDPELQWIKAYDGIHRIEIQDVGAGIARPVSKDGRVKAPIPGLVTRVFVHPGTEVETGQALLVLEAMKMENDILAPRSGMISQLNVSPGQSVTLDEVMAEIT
ncbi:MAG: biotin/lipoyl-containing protein [Chloroflexota bacterium]|nr:biotin/lipoyl-containing protein [Chloroflexota bacterium]